MKFPFKNKKKYVEVDPDEIFIDSSNIPDFNTSQFEGRLEKPISRSTLIFLGISGAVLLLIFIFQSVKMQIINGDTYRNRSENNLLRPVPIFAGRGIITDRDGRLLAWNAPISENAVALEPETVASSSTSTLKSIFSEEPVARREYATSSGLSHVLGYVQYPSKDNNGFYYRDDFVGADGAEAYFDKVLSGENGSRLIEVDAHGNIVSENVVRPAVQGNNVSLSIDSRVQSALYNNIKDIAERVGFAGGAGMIMDVHTGEVIAMTSYPEFSSAAMSDPKDPENLKLILSYNANSSGLPFMNRATNGLYTPGSIVKPYMAMGVLSENVIDPMTIIKTTGSVTIQNPYDPDKVTIFRDWKNLGNLDLRHAIAMSSDAYFYTVGGGYKDQKGLGIKNIDKYLKIFGFGTPIPESFFGNASGTIPTPEWKKKTFNEDWYLGDTYNTVIGQYGFQVTLAQVIRAVASLANGGDILVPTIENGQARVERAVDLPAKNFQIVREGMRLGAQIGTGVALNLPYMSIATKTGTAELGVSKSKVNSWVTGFWPYENPKYAFVVMLEKGSVHNLIGAAAAMRQQLEWMHLYTPEYLK